MHISALGFLMPLGARGEGQRDAMDVGAHEQF